MKIAFVGVGRMGSRMASRLIEAGHELSVYDPFAPAVEALKQQARRQQAILRKRRRVQKSLC